MQRICQERGDFENTLNERIACLKIGKSYETNGKSLYECVQKYWKVNGNRVQRADWVFAIAKGYIVGVFKPLHWFPTEYEPYKGRWEFEGEEVPDSPHLYKRLKSKSRNPVIYINM